MQKSRTNTGQIPYKEKLYMVLLDEIHTYQNLADTLKQKQEAIIHRQIEELENLNGVEHLLMNKVQVLLQTREHYLQKVAGKEMGESFPQLNEFIKGLDKEEQPRWQSLEESIHQTVGKIHRINFENQQLIRASLTYIHGLVDVLYPKEVSAGKVNAAMGNENTQVAIKSFQNVNI